MPSHIFWGKTNFGKKLLGQKYFLVNPIPYGLFNKPQVMGGGRSAPPSYMAIGGYFQYSFLTGVLSWM